MPTTTEDIVFYERDLEEAVVGAVLINPYLFPELSSLVSTEDFYSFYNRIVWEAFVRLSARNMPIDILTVAGELLAMQQLDDIGGPSYLTVLINRVPSSLTAPDYARRVREMSTRRRVARAAQQISNVAYDLNTPLVDVIHSANSILANAFRKPEVSNIKDVLVNRILGGSNAFISGIPELDELVGPVPEGQAVVFTGDEHSLDVVQSYVVLGVSRTARTLVLTQNAILWWDRMASAATDIPLWKVFGEALSDSDQLKVAAHIDRVKNAHIWIGDLLQPVHHIDSSILSLKPEVLAVDLVGGDAGISEVIFRLSYALQIPVLLFSRQTSSRIEQDAWSILRVSKGQDGSLKLTSEYNQAHKPDNTVALKEIY